MSGSIDERYPLKVTNPIRAMERCHERLRELRPELDGIQSHAAAISSTARELSEIAKQLDAIIILIRRAHGEEVEP